jgi:prevent-host-death family protein
VRLTRILTMETLPLADVKVRLSQLVSQVEDQHDQITVTRNGRPAAVIVSVDEWESLQERSTPSALSRSPAMACSNKPHGARNGTSSASGRLRPASPPTRLRAARDRDPGAGTVDLRPPAPQ